MPTLALQKNPFSPGVEESQFQVGRSIREAITDRFPGWTEFARPTIVLLNGTAMLRADWDAPCSEDDYVHIIGLVTGAALPAIQLTLTLGSIALAGFSMVRARMMENRLKVGTGAADPAPVYTLAGQTNGFKLQQPVEVAYGTNRLWPTYVAMPYPEYVSEYAGTGNALTQRQYLYQTFCVGQGSFNITEVQLGDLPVSSYNDIAYEIVPPGQNPTLIPKIYHVVADFTEIVLASMVRSAWVIATPPGVSSNSFAMDIFIPDAGILYTYSSIQITITATKLDSKNNPTLSIFSTSVNLKDAILGGTPGHGAITKTFYFGSTLPTDSYRLAFMFDEGITLSGVTIKEVRCLYPVTWFGSPDKTTMVVKYSSSAKMAAASQNKINVIATRKLSVKTKNGSSYAESFQPTQSIPWAIYDALTNPTYGGGLSPDFIDLDTFCYLHDALESGGYTFDYVFNQKTTVWDTITTIARAGRCRVVTSGSRLSLVRDLPFSIPMGVFSPENILADSLTWDIKLFDPTEPDGLEATYVNPRTGQQLTTTFLPPASDGLNLETAQLTGVTARNQAWREAAYQTQIRRLARETFTFKTGLEGFLPSIGDVLALSWPLPRFGESGVIEGRSYSTLYLSQPVTFEVGKDHYILLRNDDGTGAGPYRVTGLETTQEVTLTTHLDLVATFDRLDREPVLYTFGPEEAYATKIKVTAISPIDSDTIEITGINYDPGCYAYDQLDAPTENADGTQTPAADPGVTGLAVTKGNTTRLSTTASNPVTVMWNPVAWATQYTVKIDEVVVYTGSDNFVVLDLAFSTGSTVVSVRATNLTTMTPWASWYGVNNDTLSIPAPSFAAITSNGDYIQATWLSVIDATAYRLEVHSADGTPTLLRTLESSGLAVRYTSDMLTIDYAGKACRSFQLKLYALREGLNSIATAVLHTVPALTLPTDYSPTGHVTRDGYGRRTSVTFAATWTGNLRYRVYLGYGTPDYAGVGYGLIPAEAWLLRYSGENTTFEYDDFIDSPQITGTVLTSTAYTHPDYGEGALITASGYIMAGTFTYPYVEVPGNIWLGHLTGFVDSSPLMVRMNSTTIFVKGLNVFFTSPPASAPVLAGGASRMRNNLSSILQVYDGWGTPSGTDDQIGTILETFAAAY